MRRGEGCDEKAESHSCCLSWRDVFDICLRGSTRVASRLLQAESDSALRWDCFTREALSKLARCKERLLGVRTQSTGAAVARPRCYLSAARASLSKKARADRQLQRSANRHTTAQTRQAKSEQCAFQRGSHHRCRAARHGRADTFWQQQQRTDTFWQQQQRTDTFLAAAAAH